MNAEGIRACKALTGDHRRFEILCEIAAQLAEMNVYLARIANVDPNDPQECREKKCTYFQHYLAYGPADLTHEGYHAAEAQATAHFKNCTYGEDHTGVCPTCSHFEQRIRA